MEYFDALHENDDRFIGSIIRREFNHALKEASGGRVVCRDTTIKETRGDEL
jgi:hypothetical protein